MLRCICVSAADRSVVLSHDLSVFMLQAKKKPYCVGVAVLIYSTDVLVLFVHMHNKNLHCLHIPIGI